MPVFFDQLNRELSLPRIPQKIISVVPSQTELLFYLGLDKKITGITDYCTHPADKISSITKVGGTKKLNINLIKELNPDIIIANKEENDRGQVEELMSIFPVWISDISDLDGAINMIDSIGEVLGCQNKAKALTKAIMYQFEQLRIQTPDQSAAYLIWRKPYMVAGRDTFINSLLNMCGLKNAFDLDRYPEVSADMLIKADPGIVLLSSEPYPFKDKHIREFSAILPKAKIILVDGEMFSWYGSRLLLAPAYLSIISSLVHG